MDNAKRASMREGPLAQLFRKTDEEEAGAAKEEPKREERRPEPARQERRPEPARQERRPEPRRAEPPSPATAAGSRYEGTPTPQQRLRTVFSADIPENILEREPAPVPVPDPAPVPVPDPAPTVPAWSVDQSHTREPVLRVIGVGGAGVNAVDRMIEA